MITATCDACGKNLGIVQIDLVRLPSGQLRYAISLKRCFKLANSSDGSHRVACSIECAERLDQAPEVDFTSFTRVMPDGNGGIIEPDTN